MSEKLYTLEEATALLKAKCKSKMLEGSSCPVCSQFVKLYPYKINSLAVSDLIRLWHLTNYGEEGVYRHVADFSQDRGGTFAKLAHWGLVEAEINEDTSKRTSGMWTITKKGKQFIEGEIKVSQRAYLYNQKCLKMGEKMVDIQGALGDKFDYEELMKHLILEA